MTVSSSRLNPEWPLETAHVFHFDRELVTGPASGNLPKSEADLFLSERS